MKTFLKIIKPLLLCMLLLFSLEIAASLYIYLDPQIDLAIDSSQPRVLWKDMLQAAILYIVLAPYINKILSRLDK